MSNKLLQAFSCIFLSINVYAQCGIEPTSGLTTISTPAQILNSYYPGTANALAGTSTVIVGSIDVRGNATTLAAGDLVLIMQMQGADINSSNSDSYGDGVAAGNASGYLTSNLVAGYYEYNTIASVSGSTITFTSVLSNSYYTRAFTGGAIQSYQVIRVPRHYNLTIAVGGAVTAPHWNGVSGGVIVLDARNVMDVSGSVNANGMGFRGGGGMQMTGAIAGNSNGTGTLTNTDYRWVSPATNAANLSGGAKGEGIAGTPRYVYDPGAVVTTTNSSEGYTDGSLGWGAPGNAGGGATDAAPVGANTQNQYNTGGGGGGNGGTGGKGGSGWHGNAGDVTTYTTGGYGGAIFSQRNISQFIMGGGGGAGSANNSTAATQYMSSGNSGGGIILLRAGSFTGNGSLSANGLNAVGVTGTGGNTDAAGGGGAGGTIVAVTRTNVPNGLSAITASAIGGNGGNMETHFDHGPGGGGGGGVIIANGSFLTATVAGGSNGFTRAVNTTNPVTNSYGSSPGSPGVVITLANAPVMINTFSGIGTCGTLPIKLRAFTASLNGNVVMLNWRVDDAIDFDRFEIEFSTDGNTFTTLGQTAFLQSQSQYQYLHSGITNNSNYYRLKLIDRDGRHTYTNILLVKTKSSVKGIALYPQPARSHVAIQVTATRNQFTIAEVFSASGNKVVSKQLQLSAGNNTFTIDNLEKLPRGLYTVRLLVDSIVEVAKMIID